MSRREDQLVSSRAVGYTIVVCAAAGCRVAPACDLHRSIRARVAASRHGVLVVAGCLLGAVRCGLHPRAPHVLVQPCDADRRPVGPAVRVGPLRTGQDVAVLDEWLAHIPLDPASLPPHLLTTQRAAQAAALN